MFVILLLASGSAASDATGAEGEPAPPDPTPRVLHAEEGERLDMIDGRYVLLKATAENTGASELMMGTEALPPGTAIPVHSHEAYEEIIFIHEGDVRLTLGDEVVEAQPGTTMYVPPGTWHGVAAHGDEPATMLFIFPEPDIAEFFRRVGQKPGDPPPELTGEDWAEIMQRHQMRARD
ncbi:cupin domain-containing protein [Elongatibacter sediminis]|uniref:Cupin domain-containing protein n=1 Tax=Elongatibacter sediminis TaxID=3119006 RepID=A0AAW9R907_9GAMM